MPQAPAGYQQCRTECSILSSVLCFRVLCYYVHMKDETFCPVHASIDLLQEKWVLHIIRSLLGGPLGFNALSRDVGGVNTTTLSHRLEHLERLGIINKEIESTMPPKTRYELTDAGYELQSVIQSIDDWARRHIRLEPNDISHDGFVVANVMNG